MIICVYPHSNIPGHRLGIRGLNIAQIPFSLFSDFGMEFLWFLVAQWIGQASQGHEMYCHVPEVMSSNLRCIIFLFKSGLKQKYCMNLQTYPHTTMLNFLLISGKSSRNSITHKNAEKVIDLH